MTALAELFDHFRNIIPYTLCVIFPLLIIISPIDPIKAAQEFTVYRMQQYDYQGVKIGSRSGVFNFEAQTLGAKLLTRKCLVLKLMETTTSVIRHALSQNVGGILIILPHKDNWDDKIRDHMFSLERELLTDEYSVAILFAEEDDTVLTVYDSVSQLVQAGEASSAASALLNAVWSTGYQLYISSGASRALPDYEIINIHGKLAGAGLEEQLPTILIVAHYDAFGIAPSLSFGADSNGSGVIALLTLARVFSKLYAMSKTHPKYNLVFLLSGGGKFNYMGTRKWLEERVESGESSLLNEVSIVMCLEGLSLSNRINLHVSKPPKEGSAAFDIHTLLSQLADSNVTGNKTFVDLIHKKINLNDDLLSWEHEQVARVARIARAAKLPGMTLSSYATPQEPIRRSILDRKLDIDQLSDNVRLIAEALIRYLYNVSQTDTNNHQLVPDNWISSATMESIAELIVKYPRSVQSLPKGHRLLTSLELQMRAYLQDVKVSGVTADKRDPEFLLYDGITYTMSLHKVKPAVFELILACFIVMYLGIMYLTLENLPKLFSKFSCNGLSSVGNGVTKKKVY